MNAKDCSKALLYHLQWKVQLMKFLDGQGHFDIKELSPEDCKLGKWLCSDEITKYSSPAEIREIEKVHIKFHEQAKRVYGLKMLGEDSDARQKLNKLEATSVKLISLLTTLKAISQN
ncbi:MAG: CZB domain-containing protein [Thermodesulfovibrionales bacterium]|jgi:hypothetical protein